MRGTTYEISISYEQFLHFIAIFTLNHLFNGFKLFLGCAADRTFVGNFFVGHITAHLTNVVSVNLVLNHVHHCPFIQLGMVAFRVPGKGEYSGCGGFTFVYGVFDKFRVNIFTDGFFALEGFFQIGLCIFNNEVFNQS